MIKYKKTYMEFWGYTPSEYVPCRICPETAVDIHHIDQKGMGGSKTKDEIHNLIALSRKCHDMVQGNKKWKSILREINQIDINIKQVNPNYQPKYDNLTKELIQQLSDAFENNLI